MSKFKVGDIIEYTPEEYEEDESGLYLITKVTKHEYELTTTVDPLESTLIGKFIEGWKSIKLV